MRSETIHLETTDCPTVADARNLCPWAAVIIPRDGGWYCCESVTDVTDAECAWEAREDYTHAEACESLEEFLDASSRENTDHVYTRGQHCGLPASVRMGNEGETESRDWHDHGTREEAIVDFRATLAAYEAKSAREGLHRPSFDRTTAAIGLDFLDAVPYWTDALIREEIALAKTICQGGDWREYLDTDFADHCAEFCVDRFTISEPAARAIVTVSGDMIAIARIYQ